MLYKCIILYILLSKFVCIFVSKMSAKVSWTGNFSIRCHECCSRTVQYMYTIAIYQTFPKWVMCILLRAVNATLVCFTNIRYLCVSCLYGRVISAIDANCKESGFQRLWVQAPDGAEVGVYFGIQYHFNMIGLVCDQFLWKDFRLHGIWSHDQPRLYPGDPLNTL